MNDVTMGQYYPGNSLIHRMDARTKLLGAIIYAVAVFLATTVSSFGVLFAVLLLMIAVARLPIRIILKGLKPILIILLFTTLFSIFLLKGETVLFEWRFICIYQEGVIRAGMIILRLVLLMVGIGVLMTYTTTPTEMADGFEHLFSFIKAKGVRHAVHYLAMLMNIALRFIPYLSEKATRIMNAQKARGADFTSGGLIRRIKALIPVIIPLFVSSFELADELAVAMECRCYRGGDGKTRMNVTKMRAADYVMLVFLLATCVMIPFVNRWLPWITTGGQI